MTHPVCQGKPVLRNLKKMFISGSFVINSKQIYLVLREPTFLDTLFLRSKLGTGQTVTM